MSITDWKEQGDQEEAIDNVEKYYENLKSFVWNPKLIEEENKEMQELEASDAFLAAGKRNLQRVIPASYPNQESIEEILNE